MQNEPAIYPYPVVPMLLSVFIVAEIIASQRDHPDLTTAVFTEKHETDISQYLLDDSNKTG